MSMRLLHFLLVEDDDDHAHLVLLSLKRHRVGNTVDRVQDGIEALEYLRGEGPYAGKPRPDVILLDLNMPRMGGLEFLERVKEDRDDRMLREIPVVVLTTSDAESDRARAYQHHANSYLVKPIDFNRFAEMVQDLSLYWGVWNRPAHGQ